MDTINTDFGEETENEPIVAMLEHPPIELLHEWCTFGESRVYVLWAIARRKHNEELTNSSEIVYRKVIRSAEDIERAYHDVVAPAARHPYTFRVYVTVNARNTVKAYYELKEKLTKWGNDMLRGDEHATVKMSEVDSRWRSIVHGSLSKDDSYFVYDVDDVDEAEIAEFVTSLSRETAVRLLRETPNGYHVVTDAFNYTEWEAPVPYDSFETDGQLYIDEIARVEEVL